jgi:hypothetical protein
MSNRIDDIQDQTELRRGKPATHMIFGIGQTINSAYFQCIKALNLAYLASPGLFDIAMGMLKDCECVRERTKFADRHQMSSVPDMSVRVWIYVGLLRRLSRRRRSIFKWSMPVSFWAIHMFIR